MAQTNRSAYDGPNLEVRRDTIRIDSLAHSEADPNWTYIDQAGHGHFYGPGYPTLNEITETAYDPDDGSKYQVHLHWECRHCREVIVPARRFTSGRSTIPGLTRYLVDGLEVPREDFIEHWRRFALKQLEEQEAAL
jgi:hypothetical protein